MATEVIKYILFLEALQMFDDQGADNAFTSSRNGGHPD
jgi:hypothetical protein